MGVSGETDVFARTLGSVQEPGSVRVLGLGNEILADDALGILVAREVGRRFAGGVEAFTSSAAGFHLLDYLVGASRLLLVDTVLTGKAEPGTIHIFGDAEVPPAFGGGPHGLGVFEVLAMARKLHLAVPDRIAIVTVEAADCTTVGGAMHPRVEAAIPKVVDLVGRFLEGQYA